MPGNEFVPHCGTILQLIVTVDNIPWLNQTRPFGPKRPVAFPTRIHEERTHQEGAVPISAECLLSGLDLMRRSICRRSMEVLDPDQDHHAGPEWISLVRILQVEVALQARSQ